MGDEGGSSGLDAADLLLSFTDGSSQGDGITVTSTSGSSPAMSGWVVQPPYEDAVGTVDSDDDSDDDDSIGSNDSDGAPAAPSSAGGEPALGEDEDEDVYVAGVETKEQATLKMARDAQLREVLGKLLDLNVPKVSAQMVNFLCKEHVMMNLLRFITRVDIEAIASLTPWDEEDVAEMLTPAYFAAHRDSLLADRRDVSAADETALKRAFKAMNMLSKAPPNSSAFRIVQTMGPVIVREAFRIFRADSKGSFHHLFAVVETVIRSFPSRVVACMSGPTGSRIGWFFTPLLNNLHQPRMADLLVDLVTLTASPKPAAQEEGGGFMSMFNRGGGRGAAQQAVPGPVRRQWCTSLAGWGLLEHLARHIYSPEYPDEHVALAATSFMKILNVVCKQEQAAVLVKVIGMSNTLLKGIATAAFQTPVVPVATEARPEDPPESSTTGAGAGAGAGSRPTSSSGDATGADPAAAGTASDAAARTGNPISERRATLVRFLSNLTELAFKPTLPLMIQAAWAAQINIPQTTPNALASVAGLVYARLIKEMPQVCAWFVHTHHEYHTRFGTASEATKGVARAGSTPKSPYKPSKRTTSDESGAVRYSGYTVRAPFGSARLSGMRLLCTMAERDPTSLLGTLTPALWSVLTTWFLEYRHNNLYHVLFTNLWTAAIMSNHPTLPSFLPASGAVPSFIEHYRSGPNSSAKGTIVKMLNVLRLKVDSLPPTEWLRQYLRSLDVWTKFVPDLREETKRQLRRAFAVPRSDNDPMRIRAGLASTAGTLPPRDDVDVDLGSEFAAELGFGMSVKPNTDPDMPLPSKKRKKKKKGKRRRKGNAASPAQASPLGGEDSGASAASSVAGSVAGSEDAGGDPDADDEMCNTSSPVPGEPDPTNDATTRTLEAAAAALASEVADSDSTSVGSGGGQQGQGSAPGGGASTPGSDKKKKRRKRRKKKSAGSDNNAGAGASDGGGGGEGGRAPGGDAGDDDEASEAVSALMAVD